MCKWESINVVLNIFFVSWLTVWLHEEQLFWNWFKTFLSKWSWLKLIIVRWFCIQSPIVFARDLKHVILNGICLYIPNMNVIILIFFINTTNMIFKNYICTWLLRANQHIVTAWAVKRCEVNLLKMLLSMYIKIMWLTGIINEDFSSTFWNDCESMHLDSRG